MRAPSCSGALYLFWEASCFIKMNTDFIMRLLAVNYALINS